MNARRLFPAELRTPEPGPSMLFQRGRSAGGGRPRRTHLRFRQMLLILTLIGAFFLGLQQLSLTALGSSALSLKTVTIIGATDRTMAEIRGIMDSWQGTNLFVLDAAGIRAAIEGLSWIKEARVAKRWPSRVEVVVRERTAMAVLDEAAPDLVDEEGVRLEAADPAQASEFPLLRSEDGFESDYSQKIGLARKCLAGLSDETRKNLAVVDVGLPGRVGLQLKDRPVWVYLDPDEVPAGLAYFENKVAAWQERFGLLEYVDLTVPDRAYLGPVNSAARAAGPARTVSPKEVW